MKHDYAYQPLTESETELVVGGNISIARAASITC